MPDLARSVALQEEKFIAFKGGLEHCLGRYHKVLGALTTAEVSKEILSIPLHLVHPCNLLHGRPKYWMITSELCSEC